MALLKIYNSEIQQDIENFYKVCFNALGWCYEPVGRHSDTVNIQNEYMSNGCFWYLYDDEKVIGTSAVRTIQPGVPALVYAVR